MAKESKPKIILKPDPGIRRNIHVTTLNKIKSFLSEQLEPIFKSEMVKQLGIDYNSLNLALTMIKFKTDKEGRISIIKKKKKRKKKK